MIRYKRKQIKDKTVKYYIVVIIIGIPLIIYLIVFYQNQNRLFRHLENTGVIDTAVIIRDFYGAKRKLYYEYNFAVNGKEFNGFLQYSPNHGSVYVGDSVLVKYLPDDPDGINKLIVDKDEKIIKLE